MPAFEAAKRLIEVEARHCPLLEGNRVGYVGHHSVQFCLLSYGYGQVDI